MIRSLRAAVLALCFATQPLGGQARPEPDTVPAGATRLFFTPTARTLPAGAVEIGTYELVFPFFTIAPADWLMISAGTPLSPPIVARTWYAAPKVRLVDAGTFQLAAGGLVVYDAWERDGFGLVWGVATMGPPGAAVSTGVATGAFGRSGFVSNRPLLFAGAELWLRRPVHGEAARSGIALVAESYTEGRSFLHLESVAAAGLRFFDKSTSVEVLVGFIPRQGFLEIPLVSFTHRFSRPGR